jgi:hypothetical protein
MERCKRSGSINTAFVVIQQSLNAGTVLVVFSAYAMELPLTKPFTKLFTRDETFIFIYASKFRYNCSVIRRSFVAVPLTWYSAGKRTTPIVLGYE